MIRIGITGGIGSGKTLICQVFSRLNVPVYYADLEARFLSETDPEIKQGLKHILGENIFTGTSLNAALMSDLIFNNMPLLNKVNQIIHPRVAADFEDWCKNHNHYPYVIEESALLFESHADRVFDRIITVTAPENIRYNRVILRKNMTAEKIQMIFNNQIPEVEKAARSHHIIVNDGNSLVIPQVLNLHYSFIKPE